MLKLNTHVLGLDVESIWQVVLEYFMYFTPVWLSWFGKDLILGLFALKSFNLSLKTCYLLHLVVI
jgi:hypothetical protein